MYEQLSFVWPEPPVPKKELIKRYCVVYSISFGYITLILLLASLIAFQQKSFLGFWTVLVLGRVSHRLDFLFKNFLIYFLLQFPRAKKVYRNFRRSSWYRFIRSFCSQAGAVP